MTNENCLSGMKCPNCGNTEPFSITATSTFSVFDSGTDGHDDVEWDADSDCRCPACGKVGVVSDFKEESIKIKYFVGRLRETNGEYQYDRDVLLVVNSAHVNTMDLLADLASRQYDGYVVRDGDSFSFGGGEILITPKSVTEINRSEHDVLQRFIPKFSFL